MAEGSHTDDALICAVNTENRVYLIVVKCAYFATAEVWANRSEGEAPSATAEP